jgi:pilus assembly protein Flp/PilA
MDTRQLSNLITQEDGSPATEYALLAALIAVAIVMAVTAIGVKVNAVFNSAATKL